MQVKGKQNGSVWEEENRNSKERKRREKGEKKKADHFIKSGISATEKTFSDQRSGKSFIKKQERVPDGEGAKTEIPDPGQAARSSIKS